ncbi:MAG: LamG domain-containing protein, partial [Methanosarcinales archaeon]
MLKISDLYKLPDKQLIFLDSELNPVAVTKIEEVPYTGKIYSVTVQNRILLVRRGNTTAVWCGNSNYDLQLLELKCGNRTLEYQWRNDSVFIQNYSCNETGYETCKVLTQGKYTLEFRFDGDVEYVHNQVGNPNCTIVSVTPGDLKADSTGTITAIINCTDPAGINTSRFFITTTVEYGLTQGPPNRWSIRPPVNKRSQNSSWAGHTIPQILRAYNRGNGEWFDFGWFDDNFSYGVFDNSSRHVEITNGTTWAELNYTWNVEPTVFRNSFFLNRKQLETETKKNYNVYANNPLLVKFWDLGHMRGASNYTIRSFINMGYSGSPNQQLVAYYCNSSYRNVSVELPDCCGSDATANMTGNVLLMHMDETSGPIMDYSGKGNDGTNHGTTGGVAGKFGTALWLDGTDYVSTANDPSLNMHNSDYTIEVWAWVDESADYDKERILVEYGNCETGTYQLTSKGENNFQTYIYGSGSSTGSTGSTCCSCDVDWTDGGWHHLVGVFNTTAGCLETYYDGALCAKKDYVIVAPAPGNFDSPLYIGSRCGIEQFFVGKLDELAIYNRSLSAAEILDHYKRGVRKASEDTDNCVYLDSFDTSDLDSSCYTSRNSSYSNSCFGVNTSKIGGIDTTDTGYI